MRRCTIGASVQGTKTIFTHATASFPLPSPRNSKSTSGAPQHPLLRPNSLPAIVLPAAVPDVLYATEPMFGMPSVASNRPVPALGPGPAPPIRRAVVFATTLPISTVSPAPARKVREQHADGCCICRGCCCIQAGHASMHQEGLLLSLTAAQLLPKQITVTVHIQVCMPLSL